MSDELERIGSLEGVVVGGPKDACVTAIDVYRTAEGSVFLGEAVEIGGVWHEIASVKDGRVILRQRTSE